MKVLLLDIDYTLREQMVPRPHLKEFMEYVCAKYKVHFYTAGTYSTVADMCRILFHQLGMDQKFIRNMQRGAISREICPPVNYKKANGGIIEIKCMQSAADHLEVNLEDCILVDDAPSFDHPHLKHIIQAEGFMASNIDDDYLLRLMEKL